MYSDMSSRTMARSSSNRNSASARAVSVFPTPVGPRKMNEPVGRFGSCRPARALLLERRGLAVGDLGRLLEAAAAGRLVGLRAQLLQLRLLPLQPPDRVLLRLPLGLHHLGPLPQLGQLRLDLGAPLA